MADRQLLVAPLPACYTLHFGDSTRPETDLGALPDTITLTRPFEDWDSEQDAGGYAYPGVLPDSVLPRSMAMARVFDLSALRPFAMPVVTFWTATRDSLILSVSGTLRAVSVHLGSQLKGVWHESHDGERRTGTLRATRISCGNR
jgi:hypothetical protein